MRAGIGVLFFALLFFAVTGDNVRADNYIQNDSSFIDFSNGSTTLPGNGSGGAGQNGSSGGGDSGGGQSAPGQGVGGSNSGGGDTSAIGTVGTGPSGNGGNSGNGAGGSGGNGSGQGGSDGTGSGSDSGSGQADAAELFGTLTGNQAISVKGGAAGTGSANSWDIEVNGAAVRSALKARGIGKITIPGFGDFASLFSGLPTVLKTGQDFAVVAASTALKNAGIESVSLTVATLHITYRARGNLLAFIPIIYRIKIDVNPDETNSASRIQVRFPWYKFFLQTYVSKQSVTGDVEAAIAATPKSDNVIDTRAQLLSRIADSIQKRFDTVDESVSAD